MKIYENHAQDARYDEKDTCPTITSRYGTGGGNIPLVLYNHHMQDGRLTESNGIAQTISARDGESGSLPLVLMDQGGGVMSIEHDKVGTLRAQTHGHEPLVLQEVYRISSDSSNCMKSGNPHSGINRAEISPTLDTTDPSPSKSQGGVMIVQAVYENQRAELRLSDRMNSITTPGGKAGQGSPVVLIGSQGGGALPHVFKLRSGCDGGGKGYLGSDDLTFTLATNNDQYVMTGDNNGNAEEANARTLLRILRKEVGAQAFAEWRSRILDSLQSTEVLQSRLYGESFRAKAEEKGSKLDDGTLSRPKDLQAIALLRLWQRGPDRSTPQGLELAKQLSGEFGESLSRVSYEDSPEGTMGTCRVRKLTPRETERLQGFPDDHTRIPWKGKPAEECPDSPRYKAIGNSWAVPCVRWIGERIQKELEKNEKGTEDNR